ncbi:radical SAM protein [Micromonospora chersina]|uniref:radical SAM protein n=1 Tax=Micromonospora chersina TaxID=47854 RepID=UPI0036D0D5E5
MIDVVQQCNLRCLYCHPGKVWLNEHLPVAVLAKTFAAIEEFGPLEVVLSGGEILMHPEFGELLDAASVIRRPGLTVITNATLVDDEVVANLRRSTVSRICVSVDGVEGSSHASARGRNLRQVMHGLRLLRESGKEMTVISVAHKGNYQEIVSLSRLLTNEGLADQHHICAPVYSGTARQHYARLRLDRDDFYTIQRAVDEARGELLQAGLFLTFNSFWPATGEIPAAQTGRTLTLQQLAEQQKDSNIHIRPSGDVRIPVLGWGRETVGGSTIGNVRRGDPAALLVEANRSLRAGGLRQLRREDEAVHKFQLRTADDTETNSLLDSEADPLDLADLIPIAPLSSHPIMRNSVCLAELQALVARFHEEPAKIRVAKHATGIIMIFQRDRSFVTLVQPAEWKKLNEWFDETATNAGKRVSRPSQS